MTAPTAANVAQGHAHVGIQAQAIHGNAYYYQLPPDASAEEKFRYGVKYLDARMLSMAQELIEKAVAEGYRTNEVHFHRLLALLSGRTLRQLASEDFDRLKAICQDVAEHRRHDEWSGGLRAVLRLLDCLHTSEIEQTVKEIDELVPDQRRKIVDHLGVLLEGPMVDQMWRRSVEQARVGRTANQRAERIWKFFHPKPASPRVRRVEPMSVPPGDWLRAGLGTAAFVLAAVKIAVLLVDDGGLLPILGFVGCVAGLGSFGIGGADRHFRRRRMRTKDARLLPPRQRRGEAPEGGFARKVDRQFTRYFGRYLPTGTDRSHWLKQTAGIRRHLRDELVELYREERIDAEQIAWLVRFLVSDVRQRWASDTLTAYRQELRLPTRATVLILAGLAGLVAGSFWVAPATVLAAPLAGPAWLLLAVVSAVFAVRSTFRIVAERRRVAADEAERAEQLAARQQAFDRWQRKLADKPSDAEMAAWLECDRKILVDLAMRRYRLRPSQVIAHAFIEAPAASYKRARYPGGPWRYSRYRLLLFLLTDDGVRQVNIDLDFQASAISTTQRLNYRFDAVAAVRIDGMAEQQQTFELTLFNGEPISVQVAESNAEGIQPDEDPSMLAALSLDASGLMHTLHVLEGIAAEGKEWVRHRRQRADERIADLTGTLRDLLD
ncbi:hypothetical protein ACWEH1_21405 [Micromonospora chersina]